MVKFIEMSAEVVFREPLSNIINVFPNTYTKGSSGPTHILQSARTFNDVSHMGSIAGDQFSILILGTIP